MKIHDERGLVREAENGVKKLETRLAQARKELATLGWDEAVADWRATYKKELPARLETLEADIQALIEEHKPGEGEKQPRKCRRALEDLHKNLEALERLREALGDADPAARAKWVRLKSRDADEIREEMEEAEDKLEVCRHQDDEGIPTWLLWAAGGLLVLLAAAALLLFLRRR